MTIENTMTALKIFCTASSGNENEWHHNGTYYRWNIGRDILPGQALKGVVRKNIRKDSMGNAIWALAGSFTISPNGKILRFTGLGKKVQKFFLNQRIESYELI